MVVGLVAHGDALALAFTVRFGVDVLAHGRGVADRAVVLQSNGGHSNNCNSASKIVEVKEISAVRIIETFAVCVKLRTDFLEALSTFSTVITIVIRNTICLTSFLIFRNKKDRWLFHRRAGVSTVNLSVFSLVWDG